MERVERNAAFRIRACVRKGKARFVLRRAQRARERNPVFDCPHADGRTVQRPPGCRCLPRRPSFALLSFGADADPRAGGLRFSAERRNARLLLPESVVRAGAEMRGLVPHPFGGHSRDSRPRRRRAVRKQGGMLGVARNFHKPEFPPSRSSSGAFCKTAGTRSPAEILHFEAERRIAENHIPHCTFCPSAL